LIDFIRVGGTTEVEVKEKKDRVADATQPGRRLKRASFPGGGIGPLLAIPSLGQSEAYERQSVFWPQALPCGPKSRGSKMDFLQARIIGA
jgi:chaperonin GroEL (HSP60 family)